MKKIYILLLAICLAGCFTFCGNKENSKNLHSTIAFKEGLVMTFLWIHESDTTTIKVAAIVDTTFHSKGLRVIGFHQKNDEAPLEISGIYYPDSGYQCSLMDRAFNETGILKIRETNPNKFEVNYISSEGKKLLGAIHHITSPKNLISIQMFDTSDCKLANDFKNNPKDIIRTWDTVCSHLQVFWPKPLISDNKEKWQDLLFDYNKLKIEQIDSFGYIDFLENCFPISQTENHICIYHRLYLFAGGGHGMPGVTFDNIDIINNKILKLGEILDTTQLSQLTKIAERLFIKENGEMSQWNFPDKKFYLPQSFGILEKGILFQYGAYEVGSYVQGMPKVFIPYSKISSMLKPGFRP